MRTKLKVLACLAGVLVPGWLGIQGMASADQTTPSDETFTQTATIPVPGGLNSFDIGFVDADIHTYVLADRTNKAIDVVDTNSNTLTKQLHADFVGACQNPAGFAAVNPCSDLSGPNGVIIVDHKEVWAADAPVATISCKLPVTATSCTVTVTKTSTLKAIDIATGKTIVMDTGGVRRNDELCEDVNHEVVLTANDDPLDNFVTFWSTESHTRIGKIKFDGTDPKGMNITAVGIEQCKFDPRTGLFYLAIPKTSSGPHPGDGVVVAISRTAFHVVDAIDIPVATGCTGPQGLVIGPKHEILLGCGGANSLIIDDRSTTSHTTIVATLTGEGGADEAWYNPGDNQYFVAESNRTPPSFGVVDVDGNSDAPHPTQAGSHSIAVDMLKNQVYVPANSSGPLCGALNGCIAVFTATGKDDKCLAKGMPVLDHDDGDDPVFMRTHCDDDRRADRDDHERDR